MKGKQEEIFDAVADSYDDELRSALHLGDGFDLSLFAEYKVDILCRKIAGDNISAILEFGCGTGRNMPF
jgi:hypothetical protein